MGDGTEFLWATCTQIINDNTVLYYKVFEKEKLIYTILNLMTENKYNNILNLMTDNK